VLGDLFESDTILHEKQHVFLGVEAFAHIIRTCVFKKSFAPYAVAIPLHGSAVAAVDESPKLSAAVYF
jgi:hypothetical protein